MIHLATSHPSPGYTDEVLELYAALELTWVGRRPEGWEERHLQVERMPFEEAVRRIGDGRISDAKTQVALLAWKELLRTGLVLEHGKEGTK
jgi:ADP-ribose pyrophosphatase